MAWALALLAAIVFVSSGLALWFLLTLVPTFHRPVWLSQRQALVLSGVCFVIQSAGAGVFTLIGVWPHPGLWFLGAFAFVFGS